MQVKVCEQLRVGQMPQATGIVGHGVDGARDVICASNVTVGALVEGIEAQQVGAGGGRRGGALGGPRDGRLVVAGQPNGAFVDGAMLGEDVRMGDSGGEFQIRDGETAVRLLGGDQCPLDCRRESLAPNDRRCGGCYCIEPDAPHTVAACIARADIRGRHGY